MVDIDVYVEYSSMIPTKKKIKDSTLAILPRLTVEIPE
jgi:hypothetical protein